MTRVAFRIRRPIRWSPSHCGSALTALALFLRSSLAHSAFEYRLTANGSVTYTDNLNNAPDKTSAEVPAGGAQARVKESGALYALTPGAALSWLEPRGQATVAYSLPLTTTSSDDVPPTASHALVGSGTYELTDRDLVGLSAAFSKSSQTALLFNGQNPAGVTGTNVAGTDDVVRVQLTESWGRQWTELFSSQQTSSYGTQLNLGDSTLPNTRLITNGLTLRLDDNWGTFGLSAAETSAQNSGADDSWNHLVTGTLSWTRPLTVLTTLTLFGGVSKVIDRGSLGLIGGASLAHTLDFTTWALAANHTQSGDLQTGRIFTNDSVVASFSSSPFETLPVAFNASGGVTRLDAGTLPSGEESPKALTFQANASVSYAHRYFVSSLSYIFLNQRSEGESSAIPTLTRHAVTLTVGGVYPPQ